MDIEAVITQRRRDTVDPMPDEATAAPPSTRLGSRLLVPARFNGPPRSANGGYVASRVASYVGVTSADETAPHGVEPRAVTVVLRSPVPLDTPLDVTVTGDDVIVELGGGRVAEARPGELDTDPLEPVSYADAVAARERFAGTERHPMPTCFGCGPARAEGDGLRIAPGAVGDGRVATSWTPDESLLAESDESGVIPAEFAWTVLDCTAGWAWDFGAEAALLGTVTGIVDEAPYAGDRCVAVAGVLGREGRKVRTASTLYDSDGRVLGRAQSIWIVVEPERFAATV